MITFTPGQELQYDGDPPATSFAKRYYIDQYLGKPNHIWYLRINQSTGKQTIHDGSVVSFTAGPGRLPPLLILYWIKRIP